MKKKYEYAKLINRRGMFTKEIDGGKMTKTIEKIVINPDGIDVISVINGVNNITQLNLEPEENEVQDILDKYNLSSITAYPFDMNIVRGLEENEEQLRNYLEICKFANKPGKEKNIFEGMPQIVYDLLDLRNSGLDIKKQIQIYKDANNTKETFKKTHGKVEIKIGMLDKAYFAIQKFLQEKNRKPIQTLNSGHIETSDNFRMNLRDKTLTEKTNQVAAQYITQLSTSMPENIKEEEKE